MSRKAVLVLLAGVAAGVGVASIMLRNDVRDADLGDVALVLAVGWSFVASGLIAWNLRPENRIGPVMILTGFLRFAGALDWSRDPLLFSIGHSLTPAYLVGIASVLLTFPSGRLASVVERWLFGAIVVAGGPLHIAWMMFAPHRGACIGCPDYVFQVARAEPVARAFEVTHEGLGVAAGLMALGALIHRWREASAPLRFAVAPVLWVGAAAMVGMLFWIVAGLVEQPLGGAPEIVMEILLVLVPVAFLVGVARTRLARSAVADLVVGLGDSPAPGELQAALGRAMHDPSLSIAYWLPDEDRFVDLNGRPVDPGVEPGRAVTMIQREGRRIAALVHDPAALEDEPLVRSVGAAAALQLENERLQARLRAQLEEVEASRARIVEAAQEERRRIERDLHDGTQQRLVSIAMTLGLAESRVSSDPAAAGELVGDAKRDLAETLQELRDLSQGIHPGILTERGLPAALDELVGRVRMPVELRVLLEDRLPVRVEEAAYFVVSEALTNIVKYADATRAHVRVDRRDGVAVMRVSDDGAGGADATRGSGLRGLQDRVEALGGRLTVASPRAGGTVLEARIPCAS
ncbi:MAG TPA: sensor histidine kinase [Actinomycetota bacterium]|nr:sensor histidine kinase [Actinomycetota bacterium]